MDPRSQQFVGSAGPEARSGERVGAPSRPTDLSRRRQVAHRDPRTHTGVERGAGGGTGGRIQAPDDASDFRRVRAEGPAAAGGRPWRSVLRHLRPVWTHVVLGTLLGLGLTALSLLEPLLMKALLDQLAPASRGAAVGTGLVHRLSGPVLGLLPPVGAAPAVTPVLAVLILLAGLEAVRMGLGLLQSCVTWRMRLSTDRRLRADLVRHLLRVGAETHQRAGVHATLNRLNAAVPAVVGVVGDLAFTALPTLLYLVVAVRLLLALDVRLGLVALAFTPIPALVSHWASREQTTRQAWLMAHWSRIYGRLGETVGALRTVSGFGRDREATESFVAGLDAGNAVVQRGVLRDGATEAARGAAATVARLLVLGMGAGSVLRGHLTVGTLLAVLGYVGGLFGPVQSLAGLHGSVQRARAALDVVADLQALPDPVADAPGATDAPRLRGEIRLDHVRVDYAPALPPQLERRARAPLASALSDVSLHIPAGRRVALVGESGAGKTTLALALARQLPLAEGRLLLDGVDVTSLTRESVRAQVGVVWQQVELLADTVAANLRLGRPEASDAEVEAAARTAMAHDFITALPDGYATVLAEGGGGLSGGQRQRLALARALVANTPILVLDEATSALDGGTERALVQAFEAAAAGRTTVVIAHRLSTIANADWVVVLEQGRVVEQGPPEVLRTQGGAFTRLCAHAAGAPETAAERPTPDAA